MNKLEGIDFFNNIKRSVKISYFVASIIPLALLVYFSIRYVYPYVSGGDITKIPLNIGILLFLAVAVSLLGLMLTTRATNSSIASAQDLNAKLNSLFDITKNFRETHYADVLLRKIMDSAMSLTDTEFGALLLFDENGDLHLKASSGDKSQEMTSKIILSEEGLPNWVATHKNPVCINNVSRDSRYNPQLDYEKGFITKSLICVPLIYSGQVIGAIEMRNKKNGIFTSQDEALLSSLADQAGISITQNTLMEKQHGDFIHITEILVNAQDYMQNKKGHARRVANYANHIGKQMNFSDIELKKLYHASLLHDIGMLKVTADDPKKKEKTMQHPKAGYDLIKSISMWTESADIILCHHEWYDGKGYPMAKQADDIPVSARILAVADTFDVLTSEYSYKTQLDYQGAMNEIESHSGSQFDPQVVSALRDVITDAGLTG